MENAEQYLLSKKKLADLHYLRQISETEFERIEGTWLVIGKYHQRLWFQRMWHKSEVELLHEYRSLARSLEYLEKTIDDCKIAFHMHSAAIEFLHNSQTPYSGINLQHHTFIQKELF